jgi:hypothetical protein
LALLVAALGVVVWRQQGEIRRLSATSAAATGSTASVRHATARTVLPARTAASAAPRERVVSIDEREAGGFAATVRPVGARGPAPSPLARLLGSTEFFHLIELQRQTALDARFGELFRRLALGANELAAFKRLLIEKETAALEVVAVSESQPDGPLSPEALTASVVAARAQADNAIRASLGSERFAVYRDYEQTLPQRTVVAQLEQRLSYSPAPLAPAQAEALVKILATHTPPPAPAGSPVAPPSTAALAPVTPIAADTAPTAIVIGPNTPIVGTDAPAARVTDAAVAAAQAVLSPAQTAALRDLQGEQAAASRAAQLLRDALPTADWRLGLPAQLFLQ